MKRFLLLIYLGISGFIISTSLHCQSTETFEERLERISKETSVRIGQTAQETEEKIEKTARRTTEMVKISAENIAAALQGFPLNPIYTNEYMWAVREAEDADAAAVSHNLVSISPTNTSLIWQDPQHSRVLMVSWVPKWAVDRFFRPNLGKAMTTASTPGVYIWTTAVPQIKNFIKNYLTHPQKNLTLAQRIKRYLGLPDSSDEYEFVEMWVRPQDMFRPCLNNEITTTSCPPDPDPLRYVFTNPDYEKWFKEKRETSYYGARPFPWTRLGYSYDWASKDPKTGASEFVVKQGVPIFIHSITPTQQYVLTPTPKSQPATPKAP